MPFFETYAFHLKDASHDDYCRPADFFACDTLIEQEEFEEPGVPHATELRARANAAPRPSSRATVGIKK
ncbi:hypothetical protein [Pseudomonas mucidolens]|uniref:hypothetical protein n=1 Tax=Pseudomonas mucidolens TaxID=46679 RepID=UPI001560F46A|nr:hypothetical protein [Pseudomonas mucidolens]